GPDQANGGQKVGLILRHRLKKMVMSQPGAATSVVFLYYAFLYVDNQPAVSQVRALHVYDFDNTRRSSIGFLQNQEAFVNGGWWHDHRILEATGEGIEKEEPRAWNGWWNERIVDLVKLSVQQSDALTILLTGRSEDTFAELIKRIVASKELEFNMICLKPQAGPNNQIFNTTMSFKQAILKDLLCTYTEANEVKVYEDRPNHVRALREYLDRLNKELLAPDATTLRKPIRGEVIQVADMVTTLDPVIETAEIQRMIHVHNTSLSNGGQSQSGLCAIKRHVFFTGYLIGPVDTLKLLDLIPLPQGISEREVKFLANSILITVGPFTPHIRDKVGGIGHKQAWQVIGLGTYEGRVFAARVAPVPADASYHTDNSVPLVVLVLLKGAHPADASRIQNWQPLSSDKQFIFQTEVEEKIQLQIERDAESRGYNKGSSNNRFAKRPRLNDNRLATEKDSSRFVPSGPQKSLFNDENRRVNGPPGGSGVHRGANQSRGKGAGNDGPQSRYPIRSHNRGARGVANNRAGSRMRGGRGGYKSLDDVQSNVRFGSQGNSYQPNYDDNPGPTGTPAPNG
ncbi:MAG: hypothetical protein Q9214_000107, partial [Letrouitia sp. 1 TL-2023]